ncbi:acVLRF1 family peptidyl-tRNA hydrolase [Nocardioides zeae]|uniref:AcVLRF1 family peptidyl-tRNA hydrolase n=1 Tax=Nocardioides imazamoxiresistens TaxID=3231893 RepID=A0ABU3PT67_9ACTN|nr:acVLRF1 family peptidyl-tRNA hydrolase [Nocardioides zeae]MDT9592430.1 acVLRF1 family peptidyl-tRNA hydrolase [Nocardioides zeae]
MTTVLVPAGRWSRWVASFGERHGAPELVLEDGRLDGRAPDGSWFRASLPFDARHAGAPTPEALAVAAAPPERWGVLLVRKGGFAVALVEVRTVVASKVGRRHVQGRTKAGGQSQQRFARRRANQARAAFDAAADHAYAVWGSDENRHLDAVVGGDRAAVAEVLDDRRLRNVRVTGPFLPGPDPRRDVLLRAVEDAQALSVDVHNAPGT